MTNENNLNLTEMTRDKLLFSICPMDMKYDCCNADSNLNCDYCNRLLNKWLDEYDKQIRTEAIDDFVKACEDNQLFPMYGGYVYMTDIKEIAEKLKVGGMKNEQ